MNNDKILQFPKDKIFRESPVDIEILEKAKEKGIQNFADSVTSDIAHAIVADLEGYGIDIDNEQFHRDFALTVDSLKAAIYRSFQLFHVLHDFVDNNIEVNVVDNSE